MNMAQRIGIFGGTFDPIHIGHLAAAQDAANYLSLDRVLFVPNRIPPHKEAANVSGVADRVAMVTLAVADNPLFEMSLVELERPGPSYTLDTLRELKERLGPGADLFFLVGCDALSELATWHEPHTLLREFHLVIMDRPTDQILDWTVVERDFPDIRRQVDVVDVLELEISSSDLRERIRQRRPIRYYVLPAVERYIREHRLYTTENPVNV